MSESTPEPSMFLRVVEACRVAQEAIDNERANDSADNPAVGVADGTKVEDTINE